VRQAIHDLDRGEADRRLTRHQDERGSVEVILAVVRERADPDVGEPGVGCFFDGA
jgi:hypothetical protein